MAGMIGKTPGKLSLAVARKAAAGHASARRKRVAVETPTADELRGIEAGLDEIARGERVTLDEVLDELGRNRCQAR